MKKIYVAGPFFNKKEIKIMKSIKELLLSANLGYDFFFPMDHFIPNGDKLSNSDWGKKVFEMDVTELLTSNYLFAIYNGMYSDTGTAWEIGYAYGKNIPIALITTSKNVSIMPVNSSKRCINYKDLLNGKIKDCINNLIQK